MRFAEKLNRSALPPPMDIVLAWSETFRCARTFSNYIGYLKTACLALEFDIDHMNPLLIRRAVMSIKKRNLWQPRAKRFLQKVHVSELLSKFGFCEVQLVYCMLYAAAYIFLLRVPSEALPMVIDDELKPNECRKSVLVVGHDCVRLHLSHRKNTNAPSVLTRKCWCSGDVYSKQLCPVHVFGKLASSHRSGSELFPAISAAFVVQHLRSWLRIGKIVENPFEYRPHDFRRGHTLDLQEAGATLKEILEAGGWRSPGFLKYMNLEALERDIVIQSHCDDSSGDEAETRVLHIVQPGITSVDEAVVTID